MKRIKFILTSNEDCEIIIPNSKWTFEELVNKLIANQFIRFETLSGNLIINTDKIVFAEMEDVKEKKGVEKV